MNNNILRCWLPFLLSALLQFSVAGLSFADEAAQLVTETILDKSTPSDSTPPESTPAPPNWLDDSHAYVSNSTDQLAGWIDSFFYVPRADFESAYTSLRLTFENEWEENKGNDANIKLRGKVFLPQINKRLSLVFTDAEGDEADEERGITALDNGNKSTQVGFQYKAKEKPYSRTDYRVGLRSSGKIKAEARYRYTVPTTGKYINRFTESLHFVDGEGFGVRSRYELDRSLDQDRLLRWGNNLKFAEDSNGVEWSTQLMLGKRLNDKSAISYFIGTKGETRPEYLTTAYGFGLRYRKSFYRPWLFYELEPAYSWQRELVTDDREGGMLFSARLEVLLERLR